MTPKLACGLLAALALPLCTALAAEPAKPLVIGVAVPGLDYPAYAQVKEAAEAEAAALGVKIEVADAHWSADRQTLDLERFIDHRVSGIVLCPVAPALAADAIAEAAEVRIPVVLVHTPPASQVLATFAADPVATGQVAARLVVRKLGGKGTVVELRAMGSAWDGFRDAFELELRTSTVKLVLAGPIEIHRGMAQKAVAAMLQKGAPIDAVVAVNDRLALGAADALREAGIDPASRVILGLDGLPEARQAVADGVMTATLDPRVGEQTRQALRCLVDHVRTGKNPPSRLVLLAPELVTRGPQD